MVMCTHIYTAYENIMETNGIASIVVWPYFSTILFNENSN